MEGFTTSPSQNNDAAVLTCNGCGTKSLQSSEHTVRNYLLRIYDKLGLSSRVELVLYAVSGTDSAPMPTNEPG